MKLHWSPRSPFVRKVMIAAHETGLADRLTLVRTVVAMTAPNALLFAASALAATPSASATSQSDARSRTPIFAFPIFRGVRATLRSRRGTRRSRNEIRRS